MNKIKAVKIVIEQAEGLTQHIDAPMVAEGPNAFAEINSKFLRRSMEACPVDMLGCFKCDFAVHYENGETYNGKMEMRHPQSINYSSTDATVDGHMRTFIEVYAGLRKPNHMTQEEYNKFLAVTHKRHPELEKEYKEFLEQYQIG